MNKYISYIVLILILPILLFSCMKENMELNTINNGELNLAISADGLLNHYTVTTKGEIPKTSEEQEIKSLHVFIFDADGNYLEALDDHRYQGYRSITGGKTVMNIDREGWRDHDKAKTATVVVVANVEEGTFRGGSADTHPENVSNIRDLINFVYKPLRDRLITELPESGMPMYAIKSGLDLTSSNSDNSINIEMKALMARIDVSLGINSDHTDISNTLPSLSVTECKVLNVPLATKFTGDKSESDLNSLGKENKDFPPAVVQTITNKGEKLNYTFYTFENIQKPARTEPEGGWPKGITEDQKQRYKPELADKDNSMVFQLSGKYITYNGAAYDVVYNLYLGANHTNDFKVIRNRHYDNNVTIKGIVDALEDPNHITFDTRVDVSTSNPYFVSMLKDRTLDCHFNVVPMDIYFFQENPSSPVRQKMKVEILDPLSSWVRMEKVTASQMEKGEAPNDDCIATGSSWQAGNGKRKYFTTDLVTNTLSGNTSVTLESSRDRIYFYVDENLDVWHLGDSRDQRTRTATLKLTYYENDVEKDARELVLEQSKLLEVTFHGPKNGGGNDETNDWADRIFYIEAYEEYLSHGDPLNEFENNQVFAGLPWEDYTTGSGEKIGRTRCENGLAIWNPFTQKYDYYDGNVWCSSNFYWGHTFTPVIVNSAEMDVRDLTLNAKPKTAAGYCYNKNKRNSDGSISNPKWYLPAIRELERLLEDYYLEYTEFQNNYYWSSAAGEGSGNENQNYARATKAYIKDNGTFGYYNSGTGNVYTGENGTGGFAPRKTVLRIRAARIDAESQYSN